MIARTRGVVMKGKDGQDIHYTALAINCPGCAETRSTGSGLLMLPVNAPAPLTSWGWDGNLEAPTLTPSIRSSMAPYSDTGKPLGVCHSFLRNGIWEFLTDSTHSLAGQHVPMIELPQFAQDWED